MPHEHYEPDDPQSKMFDAIIHQAMEAGTFFGITNFMVQEGRSSVTRWRAGDECDIVMTTGVVFAFFGGTAEQQGACVFVLDTDLIDSFIETLIAAKNAPVIETDESTRSTTIRVFNPNNTGE